MPNTNCTKPSSVTDAAAARPTTSAANCAKPATAAGANIIAGGTSTSAAGTRSTTGTIATTTATSRVQAGTSRRGVNHVGADAFVRPGGPEVPGRSALHNQHAKAIAPAAPEDAFSFALLRKRKIPTS